MVTFWLWEASRREPIENSSERKGLETPTSENSSRDRLVPATRTGKGVKIYCAKSNIYEDNFCYLKAGYFCEMDSL